MTTYTELETPSGNPAHDYATGAACGGTALLTWRVNHSGSGGAVAGGTAGPANGLWYSAPDAYYSAVPALGDCYTQALNVGAGTNDYLPFLTKAIYVGGTGTLSVVMQGGQTVNFLTVPAGTVFKIRCTKILAPASGGATSLVALA